jgi:hypothetical protein
MQSFRSKFELALHVLVLSFVQNLGVTYGG